MSETELEIDEGAWPERYVTGRLGASDLARFEAHLVDCQACLDRVEAAARLGAALGRSEQRPSGEQRPSLVVSPPLRRPHWARRAAGVAAALAAAVAALVIGAGVTSQRAHRTEAELSARLADTEAQLAQARRDAERAREAPPTPTPPPPPRAMRVPLLVLLATRGADIPVLRLPEPGQPVVLSVEREDPPRFSLYRATLQTRSGTAVWQDTVAPGSREAVLVGLDSSLLPPGEYRLTLEGQARGNRWTPVGEHPFRTVPFAAVR